MIVLNLCCDSEHQFEGWFASIDAFEVQRAAKQVACPHCDSTQINKLPSSPSIARSTPRIQGGDTEIAINALIDRLRELGERSEDVGDQFPEQARRMHFHEIESRPIKGQASGDELRELVEDGVPVLPIPKKRTAH